MIDRLIKCLFGFLIPEMASWICFASSSFFRAFRSTVSLLDTLLESTLRDRSFKDFSPRGMWSSPSGSLASRFTPGMAAGVAERILAKTSPGLVRDAFHFCESSSSTLTSDLVALGAAGLFAAVPGLAGALMVWPIGFFGLGGDAATGPPSFLFRSALNSGSRPAKLL